MREGTPEGTWVIRHVRDGRGLEITTALNVRARNSCLQCVALPKLEQ